MGDEFHALNNIEYASLQLGDDEKARATMTRISALSQKQTDLWLSIDARIYYDIETHNWEDAKQIEPPPSQRLKRTSMLIGLKRWRCPIR